MKKWRFFMTICLASMFTYANAQAMADDMQLVNNIDVATPSIDINQVNLINILQNSKGQHINAAIYSADDIRGNSSQTGGRIKLFSDSRLSSSLANLNFGMNARTTGNLIASDITGSSSTFSFGAILGNDANDTGGGNSNGTLPPPPGWLDPDAQITPVGDCFLPLLLLIGIYAIVKQKRKCSNKHIN